jgi:hypothetical protein
MSKDAFGYDSRLPENIRDIFMWLFQEVACLHDKWSLYPGLFGDKNNTDLLSELAQVNKKKLIIVQPEGPIGQSPPREADRVQIHSPAASGAGAAVIS